MKDFFESYFTNKVIIALIAVFLILGFTTVYIDGGLFWEERIYEFFGERNSILFSLCKLIAVLGSAKILIPILILGSIYSFANNKRDLFIGLFISIGGSYIISGLIKVIFSRTRPLEYMLVEQGGYSFPSTHAFVNSAFSLFIGYYLSKYVNCKNQNNYFTLAIIYSLLVAFSRVYLGVHYISDVIGGLICGTLIFLFIVHLLKYLRVLENKY